MVLTRRGFLPDDTPGLSGLVNQQNTCYLNSAIQVLSNCPPFLKFIMERYGQEQLRVNWQSNMSTGLAYNGVPNQGNYLSLSPEHKDVVINNTLANQMAILFEKMWSNERKTIQPQSFRQMFCTKNPMFKGSDQHDSQEALSAIIDIITIETADKKPFNFDNLPASVLQYNQAIMYVNNKLEELKTIDVSPEERKQLEVELKQYYYDYKMKNIHGAMLSKYFLSWQKYLSNHNGPMTDMFAGGFMLRTTCMEESCDYFSPRFEVFTILSLPVEGNSLADCLKSYFSVEEMDKDNMWHCDKCNKKVIAKRDIKITDVPCVLIVSLKRFAMRKISRHISIPIQLDIKDYVQSVARETSEPTQFTLTGMINHVGGLHGGHYNAFAKNGDGWFKYDDTSVDYVNSHNYIKQMGLNDQNAYVMIYVRDDIVPIEQSN
jgi:ubiquitin carboxyl-terminal hydrolase 8